MDPPPVVELRIYEGQTWELAQEKDITFVYNANFFLFATLEHARIMAHARGTPAPATNMPPVLTGMPVSGMAYLDRPIEAGYFLFPDLSVRHEGRYRLTFNLYEETKEDKDKDKDCETQSPLADGGLNPAMGGSFDFRMEVKSQEFVVYSAKKFPGLAESTQLSRLVAEQGCRVRIRRDVRMRRREGKGTGGGGGGGGGDYENGENEYARRRRTATPDTRPDYNRARSMSGSTERTPYSADSHRRPSMADYPPQYASQNPPVGGHLQFLGGNTSSQYPAQPPQSFAQPPSVPASPVYSQSQGASYPSQSYSLPPPPPPPPAPASYSRERTPSQSYPPVNPAPRRDSVQPEYRPSSGQVALPPLPPPAHYRPTTPKPMSMPPPKPQTLPPLQVDGSIPNGARLPMPMPSPTALPRPPALSSGNASNVPSGPSPSPGNNTSNVVSTTGSTTTTTAAAAATSSATSSSSSGPVNPATLPPPSQYAGTKRTRDETFRSDPEQSRFQDGARDPGLSEDLASCDVVPMIFRRADGSVKDAAKCF